MSFGFTRGVLALLALAAPSLAQAQTLPNDTIDPKKVLPHFSSETIDPTMKTVTANHLVQADGQGGTFVSAYTTGGLQFTIHFHQCTEVEGESRCAAMQLLTSWQVEENVTGVEELVASAAPNNLFVNMGRTADGRPYMARVVIAGQGISQANLASEIEFFIASATGFGKQLLALSNE